MALSKAQLSTEEAQLLSAWEEVYKKGQLTFWILLALKESPKHMGAIHEFIQKATQHTLNVEEQSLYRALRRYLQVRMVECRGTPGDRGPDRKLYALSPLGERLLTAFIERNIALFTQPHIQKLLNS